MTEQVTPISSPQEEKILAQEEALSEVGEVSEVGQLSLGRLIWRRFLRSRLAVGGGLVLLSFYIAILFAEFVAPYSPIRVDEDYIFRPPQSLHFIDADGQFHFRPFVYGTTTTLDTERLEYVHEDDPSQTYPLRFFVRGTPYQLWSLIESDLHLFGVDEPGTVYVFGTDRLGRDRSHPRLRTPGGSRYPGRGWIPVGD